jgi:hypothetical protein
VGLTRQTAGDGKAEHGDDGGSRSPILALSSGQWQKLGIRVATGFGGAEKRPIFGAREADG